MAPDTYSCECPENLSGTNCDETEFNGFKYLIVDEPLDWESARDSCVARGYNLTSITTSQEMDFLHSFVGYTNVMLYTAFHVIMQVWNFDFSPKT